MDKLVFLREGKISQVTTLTGEPAGQGLCEQACTGPSETLQYVGVWGGGLLLWRLEKPIPWRVMGRESVNSMGSLERGLPVNQRYNGPPDYAGWSAPVRLQNPHLALCCGDQGWQILTCPGYACPLVDISIMAPSQSLGGGSISCLGVHQRGLSL